MAWTSELLPQVLCLLSHADPTRGSASTTRARTPTRCHKSRHTDPVPGKRRDATLDDVARAAGVSAATASRVLSGRGPASKAARQRVAAAATELHYVPHAAARALAT